MGKEKQTPKKKLNENRTRKCRQSVEIKYDMGCGLGTKPGKESVCIGVASSRRAPTPAPSTTGGRSNGGRGCNSNFSRKRMRVVAILRSTVAISAEIFLT